MNYQPMHDNVVIQARPVSEVSAGGIVIPGSGDETCRRGVILAQGPGRANRRGVIIPMGVEPGREVLFMPAQAQRLRLDGEEFWVTRASEILATIDP